MSLYSRPCPKIITPKKKSKVQGWEKIKPGLKRNFAERGITRCELKLKGCLGNWLLQFCHRFKRVYYYPADKEHLLGDFKHVILGCQVCHDQIEVSRKLTEEKFEELRGPLE